MKLRIPIVRSALFLVYLFGSVASAQTALTLSSAEQSSTAFSGAAARAIDGNTNGTYRNKSVTHTQNEEHPWWHASLGSSKFISEITIYNRTDSCCTSRLEKFFVYTSDEPFSEDADRSYKLDNDPNVQQIAYVHSVSDSSVTVPVNRSAKYIRLQMGTVGTLSLAEVEVTGVDSTPIVELSLSEASQSSTRFSGAAARAIDGDTNGVWKNRSVTHTATENQSWWQASLPSGATVSEVQIWNRTDSCCTFRLSDFYVFVSDSPFNNSDSVNDLVNDTDVDWYFHTGELAESNVTIPMSSSGEYIRIQLSGVNALSLAEVKVFGTADDGQQSYSKTLDVTTHRGYGGYDGNQGWGNWDEYGPGFDFTGYSSLQSYPTNLYFGVTRANTDNDDVFLIDGTEQFVSIPPIQDDYWRQWEVKMGLAEGYLHVLATIRKSNYSINTIPASWFPPLLLDSPNEIWNDDSFEIYFNTGNESTAGYDENDFVRVYQFPDQVSYTGDGVSTTTGVNSNLNLTNDLKCSLEEWGARSCEVRFSLEELGISGLDEAEIGFDIHMNFDDDGGDRDAKYSWCSGDTASAWRDMSVVNCSLRIINDCEFDCDGF